MNTSADRPRLQLMWAKKRFFHAPFALISENYRNRELIIRLIRRDLDSRFRGPFLGYSWAIIEPLLLALVYSFVFGIIVGRSDPLYPAIVMIGVIGWSLFARCLTGTTRTLVSNASLFQFTKIDSFPFAFISKDFSLQRLDVINLNFKDRKIHEKYFESEIDHFWCRSQYLSGSLYRRTKNPAFLKLSQLRDNLNLGGL